MQDRTSNPGDSRRNGDGAADSGGTGDGFASRMGAGRSAGDDPPAPDPVDEFKAAAGGLGEAAAYFQQFIAAKVGQLTYSVKKLVLMALLGLVVAIIGLVMLITAAVLLIVGVGQAIGAAMPEGWQWVGNVVVGLVGVVGTVLIVYLGIRWTASSGRKAAAEEYERTLIEQRSRFGTDAARRARAQRMQEPASNN